jgi:hypothetical protein
VDDEERTVNKEETKEERWGRRKARERERERERERKEGRTRNDNHVEDRTYIPDGGHVAGTGETWSPQELATKCGCLFVSVAIFFVFVFSLISLSSSLHNTSRARVWTEVRIFCFRLWDSDLFLPAISSERVPCILVISVDILSKISILAKLGRKCWSYLSRFSWFCFAQDCRELLLGFFY